MAENRGGRRYPDKPASYSGVGKNSKRTDTQRVRTPNVGDSQDLAQGDRQKLEAAQRVAPLSRTPSPRVDRPAATAAGAAGSMTLGDHIFEMPSNRPGEPPTAGAGFGPGGGPEMLAPQPQDEVDIVLQGLVDITHDAGIAQMLDEHREFKAWKDSRQAPTQIPTEIEPSASFDLPTTPLAEEEGGDTSQTLPTSEEGSMRPSDSQDSLPQEGITSPAAPSTTTP